MTTGDWSIAASVLGILGSLMLFYPGWRVSRSLKTIESLRAVVHRPPDAGEDKARYDPGPEILEILEEQHTAWRPLDHWLLMGGILLIVLSFATDLFFVTLAN